jgi:hypothetical protein
VAQRPGRGRVACGRGHRAPKAAELLAHRDVRTTMIYTHVLDRGPGAVRSPLDGLVDGPAGSRALGRRHTHYHPITLAHWPDAATLTLELLRTLSQPDLLRLRWRRSDTTFTPTRLTSTMLQGANGPCGPERRTVRGHRTIA